MINDLNDVDSQQFWNSFNFVIVEYFDT